MTKCVMGAILALCTPLVWAETLVVPTEPTERQTVDLDISLPQVKQTPAPVGEQMYLGEGIEAQMNAALLAQDWQALKGFLDAYVKTPNYDVVAYQYALGAWYRSQGKHKQAIDLYEQILQKQPTADYLRFDLGIMAFENKQYKDAKAHLNQAKAGLAPALQALAERYLAEIDQRQRIRPDFGLNYEQTNNVNQAASAKAFHWQGKLLKKDVEDLPKSAQGVRYHASLDHEFNVAGNHYWVNNLEGRGIYYWNIDGYNEQNVGIESGYRYQDVRQSLTLSPFFEQAWSDGRRYSHDKGMALSFSRQLQPRWRGNVNLRYTNKHYHDDLLAKRYDGHHWTANTMVSHQLGGRALLFSGVDFHQENNKDPEKSSNRWGLSLGVVAEHDSGLGGRLSLRHAKRQFAAMDTLMQVTRQDDEYYVQSAFWHNKLSYKDFVPQLNIRYHRIDSNIAPLYSRDGVQAFISVDKRF